MHVNLSLSSYAVEMIKINKIFKNFYANDHVCLRVQHNTIHALVGENGAGKTVLMSILFGILTFNSGVIKINNRISFINSVHKAYQLGIGMVQQRPEIVGNYRVWENITIGAEMQNKWGFIQKKKIITYLTNMCRQYQLTVNLQAFMRDLSLAERQKVEILKLLYRQVNILIFDEPTSILNTREATIFFQMLHKLKQDGKTIILVSHKINEVLAHSDEITVMRCGRSVRHFFTRDTNQQALEQAMFGTKIVPTIAKKNIFKKTKIFSLDQITTKNLYYDEKKGLQDFSLDIFGGEILGVTGMEHNGQRELFYTIIGSLKVLTGKIFFLNEDITHATIAQRIAKGMANIAENATSENLILDQDIAANLTLKSIHHKPFSKYGWINFNYQKKYSQKLIKQFNIKGGLTSMSTVRILSGGNRQKVILAREMSRPYQLLVLFNPSQGLDQSTINFIYQKMLLAREQQKAILLISDNLEEIMKVSDRILILKNGKVQEQLLATNTNLQQIGAKMV